MDGLLAIENLKKEFALRGIAGEKRVVYALDGINLTIQSGVRIAIVGGSGSGKSTLAACLSFLETPTSGKIYFRGHDASELSEKELRSVRPRVQLVFQDSATAFNPDFNVFEVLEEPLSLNSSLDSQERRVRAAELLERVGLHDMLARNTEELSGGQRQRVAIARALALEPKVLILDEALSALDSSVQAQVANLLLDLTTESLPSAEKPAIVLITHDLVMAARIADEIIVMQNGRIVESGPSRRIVTSPKQEATKALVAATQVLDFTAQSGPAV